MSGDDDPQTAAGRVRVLVGELLSQATLDGRRPGSSELAALRDAGAAAVEEGLGLGSVVEVALSVAAQTWRSSPPGSRVRTIDSGSDLIDSLRSVLPVLVESVQNARRQLIRQEEVVRQEFIDDLLRGDADVAGLVQRAEPFGLDLSLPHLIVMAAPTSGSTLHRWDEGHLERAVVEQYGDRDVLVTTKNLSLVALVPVASPAFDPDTTSVLVHTALQARGQHRHWRVAAGRPYHGAYGIARSYEEAREALVLGERLQPELSVIRFRDLLIHRVLGRDRDALTDLVHTVLTPLVAARGGPQPLLDTMAAYFAAGGVATETARTLHLSVRTVTYRLDKIARLTGHDPTDPAQRFALQAAVLGARLLKWPSQ